MSQNRKLAVVDGKLSVLCLRQSTCAKVSSPLHGYYSPVTCPYWTYAFSSLVKLGLVTQSFSYLVSISDVIPPHQNQTKSQVEVV